MKLVIHSNAPINTGYGNQVGMFAPRFASLDHEVVISAFYGIQASTSYWEGLLILPGGQDPYGNDILGAHCERSRADALITLLDSWVMSHDQIRQIRERGIPVASWHPVDTATLSAKDREYFAATGAMPIAMSRHGHARMIEAGFANARYVPHGVDVSIYKPPEDRDALRAASNFTDRFAIGIAAANKDQIRKGFPEQFEAFRRFRKRHPDANAILSVHSLISMPTGLNLLELAEEKGIRDAVAFNDQYAMTIGAIQPDMMAGWFGSLDILSAASYGEGFGLPVLEAEACGTPVVVTDASAQTELCGSGWLVKGQPFWNSHHRADWTVPYIDQIVRAYEKAYELYRRSAMAKKRAAARTFALQYDADLVLQKYWVPVLAELESMTKAGKQARLPDADRDAAVERLSGAYASGLLDADTFGERAGKALAAETGDDLAALTADLPEHQEAA